MHWGVSAAVALALAAGAPEAVAQSVGGTVIAGQTGNPVAGALVLLLDASGQEVARSQSDPGGRYTVSAPGPGRYRLRFLVPGYRPLASAPFDLVAGPPLEYPLRLTAVAPELLDTLIVEGRPIPIHLGMFYRRRDFGRGRFITREDIERTGAADVASLVRRLNVFDVTADPGDGTGPRIGQRGRGRGAPAFCPVALFLNGTYAGLSGDVDVDMLLSLDGTDAMEVYRTSEVPPELEVAVAPARGGRSRGCGVVSLWSRVSPRDTSRIVRHLAAAAHAGARLGTGGVREGRYGFTLSYTLTAGVEFYPAVNIYRHLPNTASNSIRSGFQLVLALRARPLGRESAWYVGTGTTLVDVTAQPGANPAMVEGHHHLLLSGVHLPGGSWRPYVEVHVLNPLRVSAAQTSLFAGIGHRFF